MLAGKTSRLGMIRVPYTRRATGINYVAQELTGAGVSATRSGDFSRQRAPSNETHWSWRSPSID